MNEAREAANPELYRIRHSLAHVLAQAVLELRPGTTLGFGPPIADGFYYDFILTKPITEDDFPEIEKTMRGIIAEGQAFERQELAPDQALARLDEMRQLDLAATLAAAAQDCAAAAKAAVEILEATKATAELLASDEFVQEQLENHARNAAVAVKSCIIEASQDAAAAVAADVKRATGKKR